MAALGEIDSCQAVGSLLCCRAMGLVTTARPGPAVANELRAVRCWLDCGYEEPRGGNALKEGSIASEISSAKLRSTTAFCERLMNRG